MWNHFDNEFERTNNRVEGYNGKMNLACGAANPEVNKASALLKTHESTARDKYYNAQKINARKPLQSICREHLDAVRFCASDIF